MMNSTAASRCFDAASCSLRPSGSLRLLSSKIASCGRPNGKRRMIQVFAKQGGLGDENVDVAVFRFTLGIPGFEDRFIPQVVGLVSGGLLGLNHIITQPISIAQGRAELLCGALVIILLLVPEIEERLKEAQPGRGRQSNASDIAGASNAFVLGTDLTDKQKQELAWSSFALLKNTNSCGVIVHSGSQTLMARGALGSSTVVPGQAEASLGAMSKDISDAFSKSAELSSVLKGQTAQLWLPDRGAMNKAGCSSCSSIPQGAESLLVQHLPPSSPGGSSGVIMLYSERARSLSDRERAWPAAMSKKISAVL